MSVVVGCSRGELELAGFRIEGVAQALYAFSVSEVFKDQSEALALLATEAQKAVAYIEAHVEAMGRAAIPA